MIELLKNEEEYENRDARIYKQITYYNYCNK